MDYRHSAIPTRYKGVQFRSRLEARWAAFFDQLGWKWEYEPFDFSGYIPDFFLDFRVPWIVEVKPFISLNSTNELRSTQAKIQQSGITGMYALVGTKPHQMIWDEVPCSTQCAVLGLTNCDWSGSWKSHFGWMMPIACALCRQVFPDWSNDCKCGKADLVSLSRIDAMWKTAGNIVQWKGRQG